MGAGSGGERASRALVGPADIARLAGVRRPAVSNWRRRFEDFPRQVDGTSANPLFALEAVREWCREHGKAFEADGADLLWQRVRAEVPDVRRTEFTAYLGQALVKNLGADLPMSDVPEEWGTLARDLLSGEDPEKNYEALCWHLAKERGRAETHPSLAEWMADLGDVGGKTRVAVPACGIGTLLLAALGRGVVWGYAQDRDPFAWRITATRSRLGREKAVCATDAEDSLLDEEALYKQFDVVLCDPPFRDREWGYEELVDDSRWVYGLPPRGEGELAWVQHCLSLLRPGGRAVVVLPASVSYRPGGRRIRTNLVRAGALRAVLEVPGEGGESGRQTWVLVRPGEGVESGNRILLVGAVDREESLRLYRDFLRGRPLEGETGALVAEAADLVDDEVDLRPARHLAQARRGRAASHYPPLLDELTDALEQALSLTRELGLEGAGEVPETTLGALLDEGAVELLRAPVAMTLEEGAIPVLTVRDLRAGQGPSGRCRPVPGLVMTAPGDVVVAETVREAPVRVVEGAGAALGPRLLVLRPVPGRIDPGFLAGVVEPEAVSSSRTSSGRADVRSLRLPDLSLEEQHVHARARERLARNRELLERVAGLGGRLAELGIRGLREGELRPRESGT